MTSYLTQKLLIRIKNEKKKYLTRILLKYHTMVNTLTLVDLVVNAFRDAGIDDDVIQLALNNVPEYNKLISTSCLYEFKKGVNAYGKCGKKVIEGTYRCVGHSHKVYDDSQNRCTHIFF